MSADLLSGLRNGDMKAVSRLISAVENGEAAADGPLNSIYPYTQDAVRIGITGSPGVGKSTLIDKLIDEMRNEGKSVAVISVDPTSPFSGGALLGDRVRMNRHALDANVFIRSMGSRGATGGLARTSQQVADILACAGKDFILVETVGAGQVESEVVANVDMTLVVLVPESGDEIQFMKAGPIEFGDIFVINKADREGAQQIAETVRNYVTDSFREGDFVPEVLLTVATDGEGIKKLHSACTDFIEKMKQGGMLAQRRQERYLSKVYNAVKDELIQSFWNEERKQMLKEKVADFRDRHVSPYEAARELVMGLSGEETL